MAWQILRTLDFDPVVYEVELGADGRVAKFEKVEIVGSVESAGGGLSWEQKEFAAPVPVEEPPIPGLELVPFHDDLDRMTLRVTGLAAGKYQIQVDGENLAAVTATELAAGLNLAKYPALPHYKELAPLRDELYRKKTSRQGMLRDIAQVRSSFESAGVGAGIDWQNPDPASLQAALAEFISKKGGDAKLKGWDKRMIDNA